MEDGGFLGGRGGEWQAVVAGIKDLRGSFLQGIIFLRFCMEEVLLHGKKCVSMKKAHFCVGGIFLWRRDFSTEEACFRSGGLFLRQRLRTILWRGLISVKRPI